MRIVTVNTANIKSFTRVLQDLEARGAPEACLGVVDGLPGLGKTFTANWIAAQNGWPLVRAKAECSPGWLLIDLLDRLGITDPEASRRKQYYQAVKAILDRMQAAKKARKTFAILFDEVDHFIRHSAVMETIRDISDATECPTILVGMGKIRGGLSKYPQIASRIGGSGVFNPLDIDDTAALVEKLCEVPVANDLVLALHNAARGYPREIKEGIAAIEQVGRGGAGKAVDLAAMKGRVLLHDRLTAQEIRV